MSKPCECPSPGYCQRHSVVKGDVWHKLCQNKKTYRIAWDKGQGPGQMHSTSQAQPTNDSAEQLRERFRELWRQLHQYGPDNASTWDATIAQNWLSNWEANIPSFGCPCNDHWKKIKAAIPPVFTSAKQFYQWTVDVHNEVNKKLGKPHFTPPTQGDDHV